MGDFSRARDIIITVAKQNAAPLVLSLNSGSLETGLQMEEIPLVGEDSPRVEGINGPVTLQLDTNLVDVALYDLIDSQRAFNAAVNNNDQHRITATYTISLPNGSTAKYRMPKCTLHAQTSTFTGSTERVTTGYSLTTQNLRRVA